MVRKIKGWFLGDDVSNDMGGGCLVSAIRITLVGLLLFVLLIQLIKYLWM